MGYNTDFEGSLTFKCTPGIAQAQYIAELLDTEPSKDNDLERHINLEFSISTLRIKWNGGEKTYEMVDSVNWLVGKMREKWSDFALEGTLSAQGEEIDDKWELRFNDEGIAYKHDIELSGVRIECPNCECEFYYEPS